MTQPHTLGELKAAGYHSRSVKDEMRHNLIRKLKAGEAIFDGILGYEETVLPQVQNAILSKHDMLFLGLRGQSLVVWAINEGRGAARECDRWLMGETMLP